MSESQSGELLKLVRKVASVFGGSHAGIYEKTEMGWELVLSPDGERPITPQRMKELMEEWMSKKKSLLGLK